MLPVFELEAYFEPREFKAAYLLSSSDLEAPSLQGLLAMADAEDRQRWEQMTLGYTESRGSIALRQTILEQFYPNLTPLQVLVCAGAEEAIYCAFTTLLQPDDHAVVVTPCYQSLLSIPASRCAVTEVPLNPSDWSLDLKALEQALLPNTKLIVVNFPHNPTGTTLPIHQYEELIAIARRQGCYLFFDEVYRLLELDPADRLPPVATQYEKGISLSVMSKAYGLAGLRIGWLACPDQTVIEQALQRKYYLSICNAAPSEALAIIALKNAESLLVRNHALMQTNLKLVDAFLGRHAKYFRWVRPKGGCTGFAEYRGDEPVEQLADRLLQEHNTMLLPGSVYNWPSNYFRLSYGRSSLPEALMRLEQACCGSKIKKAG